MAAICSTMPSHMERMRPESPDEIVGHTALVHSPRNPLHHVELPPQHLAGRLEPKGWWRAHRGWLECPQDGELAAQVVGLEQARWFGTDPDGHVALCPAVESRDENRLGRVTDGHPVQALHRDGRVAGELHGEPRRQAVLEVARHRTW